MARCLASQFFVTVKAKVAESLSAVVCYYHNNKNKPMTSSTVSSRLSALGPGIIFSSAAVGASHLVASTQSGALFGWQLIWLILLVNVLKYPFFRFAVKYTLVQDESLIAGYYREGRWLLISFTLLNILAAVVNTAGVLLLTANLLQLFIPGLSVTWLCGITLLACLLVLLIGHYPLLDLLSKVIMACLTVATLIAVVMAWQAYEPVTADFVAPSPWQLSALAFLVAMMGWMPVPIELSAINSLWLMSKRKLTKVTLADGLFDFNLGYWVTAFLALVFVALGALVQYGSDQPIAMAGSQFASQFVAMYGKAIGQWSEYLVGFIAFLCMFGTTLTVLDGYARTLQASWQYLSKERVVGQSSESPTTGWIVGQAAAGMLIILYFQSALGPMLTFAMTVAFLTTPFFAWFNYKLAKQLAMKVTTQLYAWVGLIYLTGFAVAYLYFKLLGQL